MIRLSLNLPPVSWARPGQSGKRRYDTQKQLKFQYGLLLKSQFDQPTIDYPIFVRTSYFFHKPKSKKTGWYIGKVDIDNLSKFIFDVMQDVGIIKNDKLIVAHHSSKQTSPYLDLIEIEIKDIKDVVY